MGIDPVNEVWRRLYELAIRELCRRAVWQSNKEAEDWLKGQLKMSQDEIDRTAGPQEEEEAQQ